jgi:hypothetical protein
LESGDRERKEFHQPIDKRRKDMKKIFNIVIVCALALFFVSVSDVFAVDTTKLLGKEYKISGVAKRYTVDGYYGSAQITQGTLLFSDPATGIQAVHNIASDLFASMIAGYPEMYAYVTLGPYTTGVDKVKSVECTVTLYSTTMTEISTFGPAPCTAQIVFNSNTTFTEKITIPDFWGADSSYVLTLNGKYMGKWPSMTSSGKSIPDALLKGAPEGLPELFPRK